MGATGGRVYCFGAVCNIVQCLDEEIHIFDYRLWCECYDTKTIDLALIFC